MTSIYRTSSRRTFLKSSAALGAAATLGNLPGCQTAPKIHPMGANERVNMAVLGTGGMGGGQTMSFSRIPNVHIAAVSDADKDHMTQKTKNLEYDVAKHQDFRRVLDDKDIDAVLIATPNHWHSLMAIMACQAGKHVYVQKPVSHSIWEGRQMVKAARKYNRIVQAGTQQRSCPAVSEAASDIQSGMYGKVQWVHCSKLGSRGSIGKATAPFKIPANIDFNLWAGPSSDAPVMRKKLHYDWHWQWVNGDGEMGNWGPHYIDDLRHLLGWDDLPQTVIAAGNRFAWNDDGTTPDMHLALFQHNDVNVVVDIRNLPDPKRPDGKRAGGKGGAYYLGAKGGNHIQMERGFIRLARGGGWFYDLDGKRVKQYKGDGGRQHEKNFINAIRNGSKDELNCEIEIGHQSTAMCHMANIAFRVGAQANLEQVEASLKDHEDATNTLNDMLEQLQGNEVDLKKTPFILGPKLKYSNSKEKFIGDHANAANKFVRMPYREPFVVPNNV